MTHSDWHVAESMLTRFARDPRHVDDVSAASIETHLITCAACRAAVRASADETALRTSWDALADRIDRPRATALERGAERLGLPTASARLVGVTPGLRLATVAAVAVIAALAVIASRAADSAGPFLVLAPVVPLAAVGLLAAPVNDPAGEIGVATALHGFGIVLRRGVVSLLLTLAVLGVATIALPDVDAGALVWVLPGLALSITAVVLSSWVRPEIAVAGLVFGWATLLVASAFVEHDDLALEHWPILSGPGRFAWLAVALLAAAVLAARREHFSCLEDYR